MKLVDSPDKEDAKASGQADPAAARVFPVGPPPGAPPYEVGSLDNIDILPAERMPHLDQGPAQAYAARLKGQTGPGTFFALVCEKWLSPRIRTAPTIMGILSPGLARLVSHGVVYWPPVNGQRYVFIYENNLGMPIMRSLEEKGLGWKQEKVYATVIKPMVSVLLDMRDADVVHGNIRPTNMYDGGLKVVERVILGDCLATPPSYTLPSVFEPAERALCSPLGKGRGMPDDDLYAFGVTLCMILRTHDPLEGMSEEDIIREKMQQGSYIALTGKDRFSGAILELLRGLLYDDHNQRWTIDDVVSWMDGQRLSPKQSARKLKASRPVHFNGERYYRAPLLAMDLDKNLSEAVQMIDSGDLEQWVGRSLEDNLAKNRVEQAIESSHETGRGPGYWDRIVSRISIALDPEAPIRFKGLKVTPEGFPAAMTEAVFFRKDLQPYVDVINQQFVMHWLNSQHDMRYDIGSFVTRYDSCRAFMRQQNIAYGVERCLYFLAPECVCLSDRIKDYFVRTPEDLLLAFEDMADRPGRPELFIDRHIASYLSVHDRKVIDPYLADLNAPEMYRRILGNIKVLATIQHRGRMASLPKLCGWIASILEPVYERIHDRELRQKLKTRVDKVREGGDIGKIIAIIDNTDMRQKDFQEFRQAMIDYAKLREESFQTEAKLGRPEIYARETGREYAAILSAILAGIIIVAFSFVYFSNGGAF